MAGLTNGVWSTLAWILGAVEWRLSVTWADPARPSDGALTALDDAYDAGRSWALDLMAREFSHTRGAL